MQNAIATRKFYVYFQKKYKMSFHKANIIYTLYEMLCECYPSTELTQNIENALIKAANDILEHENSPSIEEVLLQEKLMGLPNTEHLINHHCVTVFCLEGDERILLDKLLSGSSDKGYVMMPLSKRQTMDEFAEEYLKSRQNSLTVIDLNGDTSYDDDLEFHKWTCYALRVIYLIDCAKENNAHIIATLLLKHSYNWRHIYFKIAERLKDKVCFVRFVNTRDTSNIRLQIESGENAWQYIPYRLDDDGHITERHED